MSDLPLVALVVLAVAGLVGGIGITAVGPGGVLPTIALFALTTRAPATVAGTAIATHIATGLLGTAAYHRSGHLRDPATRRTACILAGAAVLGTPVGVAINTLVSKRAFGVVLAAFALIAAVLVWRRGRHGLDTADPAVGHHPAGPTVAVVGLLVAVAAGVAGLGGPMLSVPILAALGVPMIEALAAAQAQSIVIATVGTAGYAAHGSIDWGLAALVGVPELVGVLVGWRIARALPHRVLATILAVTLLALIPYLLLGG